MTDARDVHERVSGKPAGARKVPRVRDFLRAESAKSAEASAARLGLTLGDGKAPKAHAGEADPRNKAAYDAWWSIRAVPLMEKAFGRPWPNPHNFSPGQPRNALHSNQESHTMDGSPSQATQQQQQVDLQA